MSAFDEDSTDASSFLLRRVNYERTNKLPYHSRSFKLDRMRRLLELLGDPHESLPVVHIAGTKGKGSTATMVASVLKNAGYRTGLYTSPHLMGVEERMRINGVPCPAIRLAELVDQVRPIVEQLDREAAEIGRAGDGPTYFEITTALAMLHFVQQSVDIAVLEVGLGGRLDSTNICRPLVSVITTIGFDHMAQLGNTLTAIAGEKAGIIKPGVPVVSGVTDREPRQVIQRVAVENGCKLIEAGVDFHFTYEPPPLFNHGLAHPRVGYRDGYTQIADVESNLLGRHQAANAANAIAALGTLRNSGWTIPESAIRIGVAQAECPARIEMVSRNPSTRKIVSSG